MPNTYTLAFMRCTVAVTLAFPCEQRWNMPQSQQGSSPRSRPKGLWASASPSLGPPSSLLPPTLPVSGQEGTLCLGMEVIECK